MIQLELLCCVALVLSSAACRETVDNPDYCTCATCVPQADGTCGVADGGGEGEGEGEDGGEGEGEGEGECADTCDLPNVCDPEGQCVRCFDDGEDADLGCEDPLPQCVEGACAACDDLGEGIDAGCTEGTPHCQDGECLACRQDEDCVVGDAIFCDDTTHTCRGCEDPGECSARTLGAACLPDGTCAQCDDPTDCGGDGCDPRTNLCSSHGVDSVSQCEACESDDDCRGGRACVVVESGGVEVGTYCSFPCPVFPDDCLDAVGASGYACTATVTRDGSAMDACVPARTTCEGWFDANAPEGCALSSECGAPGFDDAVCQDLLCTYGCDDDADCPPGQSTCPGGLVCR